MGIIMNDHDLLIQMDAKLTAISETLKQLPVLEERMRAVENQGATREEQVGTLKSEVEKLRNTNYVWGSLNTLGILVAGFFGMR